MRVQFTCNLIKWFITEVSVDSVYFGGFFMWDRSLLWNARPEDLKCNNCTYNLHILKILRIMAISVYYFKVEPDMSPLTGTDIFAQSFSECWIFGYLNWFGGNDVTPTHGHWSSFWYWDIPKMYIKLRLHSSVYTLKKILDRQRSLFYFSIQLRFSK